MVRKLTLVLALFALAACGGPSEYIVVGTAHASGMDGLVTVENTEGNNLITIEVEHLTPPGRVSDGATAYVVWFKPEGGTPQAQGVLDYDPDERSGRLMATTPQASLEVIVSAEVDNTATSPSDVVILRQDVSAPN